MAQKYFLGSVGTAEAFRMENGSPVMAFVSKTLTDSGLNITTTKNDVRGGTGAPIQFSFYSDPSVEITLTDVLFDRKYIEAQLGGKFFQTGSYGYVNETLTATVAGTLTLSQEPVDIGFGCGNVFYPVWYTEKGDSVWKCVAQTTASVTLSDSGIAEGKIYCVRYAASNNNAWTLNVTSQIIPHELFLIITAPIYAGDACSASSGKKAGTITYEVPRFRLNGGQEFTMNMSSNQPMSLAGIALASEDGCGEDGASLLKIIEVLDNAHWYDDVNELIADEDYLTTAVEPHIYALHKDGQVGLVDNSDLTFTNTATLAPALDITGKWSAAGSVTITITGKTAVTDTVTIS